LLDCPYRFFVERVLEVRALDEADDALDKIKEYTAEAQEKIKATIDDGKELFREKKSILSAAVEAGKEAMEKEREKFRSTEA
jgi:hypothetical protein